MIINYNYSLFLRFRTFIVSIGFLRVFRVFGMFRVDSFPAFAELRTFSRLLFMEIFLLEFLSKMHVMKRVILEVHP
jgi:hypothetical protein